MKPDLKLVGRPQSVSPIPYDEARGIRRITILRNQLIAASVRYAKEGKRGTLNDRIREASEWSGTPRNLIEIAVKKS